MLNANHRISARWIWLKDKLKKLLAVGSSKVGCLWVVDADLQSYFDTISRIHLFAKNGKADMTSRF